VAEPFAVNKPKTSQSRSQGRSQPRPLAELLGKTLNEAFAKQGFASAELVTRWTEIVGPEIAAHSQPEKIQWLRTAAGQSPEPGTLMLRVEGPTAVEIQHLSGVVIERVNRFFGWQAVGGLRLRQAPLRRNERKPPPPPDPEATARIAATLPDIADERLRNALARLGAAIKLA
jgi:hypothetical protein